MPMALACLMGAHGGLGLADACFGWGVLGRCLLQAFETVCGASVGVAAGAAATLAAPCSQTWAGGFVPQALRLRASRHSA